MTQEPSAVAASLRWDTAPARRRHILEAVEHSGFISVSDLTLRLGVSDMTIRRDLRKLAQQGRVRVVHGGVSALGGWIHSSAFTSRADLNSGAKQVIGEAAAAGIPDAATVAIDAGTTPYAAALALRPTFRGTVVTHSVPVMQLLLNRGVGKVVGLGGDLLLESQAFVGPRTVEATAGLRVGQLLLGAAAADEHGIYVTTDNERPTKLAMMGIASSVVLLVDSAKFSAPAPVLLCGWDAISQVVTEALPPARIARVLAEHAIRLTVPEVGPEGP
ncbi:MAG: DeoR/GlpR family DNA-binding transcription regulator [Lapillicoccus sp.]